MKAPTKPEKPARFGRFLLAERYKSLGRYLQLKLGRRVLLEVRIEQIRSFRDSEAYSTLSKQAATWHDEKWEPPPVKKKQKPPRVEQMELDSILIQIQKPEVSLAFDDKSIEATLTTEEFF
jgi:hypothetical protein